jgi:hypothetical protein
MFAHSTGRRRATLQASAKPEVNFATRMNTGATAECRYLRGRDAIAGKNRLQP